MAPRYGVHMMCSPPLFDPWRGSVLSKAGGWGGRFRVTSNQRGLWRFRRTWGAYKAVQAHELVCVWLCSSIHIAYANPYGRMPFAMASPWTVCATPAETESKTDKPIIGYGCLLTLPSNLEPGHRGRTSFLSPLTTRTPNWPSKINKPLNNAGPAGYYCLFVPVALETSVCCPWARMKQTRPQLRDKQAHMPCHAPR